MAHRLEGGRPQLMNGAALREEPSAEWPELLFPQLPIAVSDPWFAGKEFTSDWVHWKLGFWRSVAEQITRGTPSILEIGSWEGRSAIAWLNLLPNSAITCIDYWGGDENDRFNRNTSTWTHRITKMRSESGRALEKLLIRKKQFDLIYVDGSHTLGGTLQDTVLAWPKLKKDGIIIWDDYHWEPHLPANERPKEAIDWFVAKHGKDLDVFHSGYQIAGKRLSAGPIERSGINGIFKQGPKLVSILKANALLSAWRHAR
jgi:predicted O-methyltransferase YrrM